MEKPARVLIVDDDEIFCQLLVEILEAKGMTAVWTTDGVVGYEESLYEPFDLFILDERMPLVFGTELAEDLKQDNPDTKIILTSAFADEELRQKAQSLGVPLLSKPFSPDRLVELIESTLSRAKVRGD